MVINSKDEKEWS